MQISQASLTHLEALCELENAIFDAQSFPLSKRNFIYHLKKGNIFVAQEQTQLVGYILIFSYKKSLRIYSLAVDERFRGQNIGMQLIEYVKDLANAAHKRKLTLEVKTSNKNAIRFYEKFGFKIMKILKEYYPSEDGYKMGLECWV
ncbi:MAG: GNAT family N-acetyltransferase [Sulfurimonas sp.]|nr:GNAT family N-acetyltransferase [Sulfurimonas sp.]